MRIWRDVEVVAERFGWWREGGRWWGGVCDFDLCARWPRIHVLGAWLFSFFLGSCFARIVDARIVGRILDFVGSILAD